MSKKINKVLLDNFWAIVVIILILSIGGGFLAGQLAASEQITLFSSQQVDKDKEEKKVVRVEENSQIISTVEKASPAVVSIVATKDLPKIENYYSDPFYQELFRQFFGQDLNEPQAQQQQPNEGRKQEVSTGTGFIVSKDGYVVTNKHVVSYQDVEYTVILKNGEKHKAKVLAKDPIYDVAVLKIETEKDLSYLELGDSSNLKVGQKVIAIGNALGEFSNTVSTGVISGLSRSLVASSGYSQEKLINVIQTDASINPGNSGGPLLSITGEVIAINTAIAQGAQNIGFALPINDVKKMIKTVEEKGEIVMPWLGVRYVTITQDIQEANGLPVDYGALIVRGNTISDIAVVPSSPADKADLQANDIILEVNGEKVTSQNPLNRILAQYSPGETVELKVLHKGEEKTISVKLEERPENI